MHKKIKLRILFSLLWMLTCYGHAEQEQKQGQEVLSEKIRVQSYYVNDATLLNQLSTPSPSRSEPTEELWQAPAKANHPYNIAVLLPRLKDPYWETIMYGANRKAKRYGASLQIRLAEGYRNLGKQHLQMQYILDNKAQYDGLIVALVKLRSPKLEAMLKQLHQAGIPVISMANNSYSSSIKGKVLVSYHSMGYEAGEFLIEHSKGKKVKVLIMPGPKGSGWAPDTLEGFQKALHKYDPQGHVTLLRPIWGDTNSKAQRRKLRFILKREKNIDYLVGNALAANAMINMGSSGEIALVDEFRDQHPNIQIISTYTTQPIYNAILAGKILAAANDQAKLQGEMAVDMMIRYLNGERPGSKADHFPFRSGPEVSIIHTDNIKDWPFSKLFGHLNVKPSKI